MCFAQILLILLAPAYALFLILSAGEIPTVDYWPMVTPILSPDGLSANTAGWFVTSNEHVVLIPKLLYALNILLTGGNSQVLGLIGFAWAGLSLFLIMRIIERSRTAHCGRFELALYSMLIFSPAAYEAWTWGMSGVIWVTATSLALLVLYCFTRYCRERVPLNLLLLGGAALISNFAYSSTVMIWPALLAAGLWCRVRDRYFYLMIAGGILCSLTIILIFSVTPNEHVNVDFSILRFIVGMVTALGMGVAPNFPAGVVAGSIGLILLLFLLRSGPKGAIDAPLVYLSSFCLLNAIAYGIFRSGMGDSGIAFLNSRYAPLSATLWIAVVYGVFARYKGVPRWIERNQSHAVAVVLGIFAVMLIVSWQGTAARIDAAKWQPLAAFGLRQGIFDEPIIHSTVTWYQPHAFKDFIPTLKAVGHVPFNEVSNCDLGTTNRSQGKEVEFDPQRMRTTPVDAHYSRIVVPIAKSEGGCSCFRIEDSASVSIGSGISLNANLIAAQFNLVDRNVYLAGYIKSADAGSTDTNLSTRKLRVSCIGSVQ